MAILSLAWCGKHPLAALAETEGNPAYLEKAEKICDLLMDGKEAEYREAFRKTQ